MEQAILVPQSLQDMSLFNNNNGLVLDESLYEALTGLKNIKNVILTVMYSLIITVSLQSNFSEKFFLTS